VRKFGHSPLGILIGIALVLAVLLGSCSYTAAHCTQGGGDWNGDNLSCTHKGK